MATFDVLFKAWTSQMTEHIKEIKADLKDAELTIINQGIDNHLRIEELDKRLQVLREDFVIHKTKVNTRVTLISTGIGLVVLITTFLVNLDRIREAINKSRNPMVQTEILK